MTILEITLTGIIWIAYGCRVSDQHDWNEHSASHIIFAPIVLLYRVVVGIFNKP
jgi:hypothetical protein